LTSYHTDDGFGSRKQHTLNDPREISQIEQIMWLCGGRQQVHSRLLIHVQSGVDQLINAWVKKLWEITGSKVPGGNLAKYSDQDIVIELRDCQGDEMPLKPWRDVMSADRRTHRAHQLDVYELDRYHVLPIVPSPVIEPLTQKFDGRLRAKLFLLRHRHVVYEDHPVLAGRRTIQTLLEIIIK